MRQFFTSCRGRPPGRVALLGLLLVAAPILAQDITHVSYAFDTDPGPGGGTLMSLDPADSVAIDLSLTAPSTPGLHRLFVRFRDDLGRWSNADTRLFQVYGTADPLTEPEITTAEYFFGTDPGYGLATPLAITASTDPTFGAALVTTGLTAGLHRLHLRLRDDAGHWSNSETRLFYIHGTTTAPGQPAITAAEYFFDTDPGIGLATPLGITPSSEPTIAGTLSTAGLQPGFHQFQVRLRDQYGRWSNKEARLFYIHTIPEPPTYPELVNAEWYIDTDPGYGNGTPLTMTAGAEINLSAVLDMDALGYGRHRFNLRVQDELGRWSNADTRLFTKYETVEPIGLQVLAAAEYFINEDPGVGNGVAIDLPVDGAWSDTSEAIDELVAGIPVGRHWLGLRFRDSWGSWSSTAIDSFLVGPVLNIQPSTLPATLTWEGDLAGDMIYIYRAPSLNGPWALIDSTLDAGYIDLDSVTPPATRLYRITQALDEPFSAFRLPTPTEDPGYAQRVRTKRPFHPAALPVHGAKGVPLTDQDPGERETTPSGLVPTAGTPEGSAKVSKRAQSPLH